MTSNTSGKGRKVAGRVIGSGSSGSNGSRLSPASPYENLFKVRHRGRGRPNGSVEPLFVSEGTDPVLVNVARRRAYAVVHEEQRSRMQEVFEAELKVLRRRGPEQVASDAGLASSESVESHS